MATKELLFASSIDGVDFASFYLKIQEQAPIMYSEATLDQIGRAFTESEPVGVFERWKRINIAVGKLAWLLHSEAELIVEDFDSSDNPVYACEAKISVIFDEAREIIGHENF